MPKAGREFEEAVWAFVKTLDPKAEILFDHYVPDRDTGTMRQCDVWINATVLGHIPLSILVSCKDYKRKLHIGDIGNFQNEIFSTRANMGVIYSRHGFNDNAIAKSKANRISCCRLYQNEPPDIPSEVWFESFLASPQGRFTILSRSADLSFDTWWVTLRRH